MIKFVICGVCSCEMTCTKTGKPVRFNNIVCFYGDEFTCKKCGFNHKIDVEGLENFFG